MKESIKVDIIILCIITIVLISIAVEGKGVEVVKVGGQEMIFYKAYILGFEIVGAKQGTFIKPMAIGRKAAYIGMVTVNQHRYTVCILDEQVVLYDEDMKRVGSIQPGQKDSVIVSGCTGDLDGTGDKMLVVVGKKGESLGEELVVLSYEDDGKEILHQSFEGMNPGKIQTGDIDGDGVLEISICMYKTTPFHPVLENRPYIYGWKEGALYPKWRGSRLSRPFDDYIFSDIDGDGTDELVSVERLQDGRKVINGYRWKGFGFEGMGESEAHEDIYLSPWKEQKKDRDRIFTKVKINGNWKEVIWEYDQGEWVVQNGEGEV